MAQDTNLQLATSPRTPQQVQRWFQENGLTVVDWSVDRGFNPALVYVVLQGNRKCLRGQSHHIAVALGLKSLPAGTEATDSDKR